MKKTIIALAAAGVLAAISLNARPASAKTKCVVTSATTDLPGGKAQDKTCTDDKAGTVIMWTRGNHHDKWLKVDLEFARRSAEVNKKATEVSYSNCLEGAENYKMLGEWIGPPSAEGCAIFLKNVQATAERHRRAAMDEAIKELMEAK